MKIFLKKSKENFPEASVSQSHKETSYLSARREWNERYSDYIVSANNWRLMALGSMGIALIAVTGLVWLANQHKVVPYVVEMNSFGEVSRVQKMDTLKPTIPQFKAALRTWIVGARTVYTDARAGRNLIETTYAMTLSDSPAYQTLADYHRTNNPYQRAGRETVEVTVNAVVPISDETWQIEWTETTKQRSGKSLTTQAYQGNFTLFINPPSDEQQILLNPLGIYVRQFAWTPRL